MIHVDRSQVDPPPDLTEPGGEGLVETKAAIDFYADDENLEKKFPFKEYRQPDVKDRLIKLFRGKCAYCEGVASSVHDGDVEHFRPKGAVLVDNKQHKPGYYWLAAHWENLFFSCQHCNQKRKHRLEGGGTQTSGKLSQFPVDDEEHRATHESLVGTLLDDNGEVDMDQLIGACAEETRLLLDPCIDDPKRHLEFLDDGAVIPAETPEEQQLPLGKNSIEVFGLHRPQLVNDRRTELVKIKAMMEFVRGLAERLDEDPNDDQTQALLTSAVTVLEVHCLPEQRFSGMAHQVIDRFKKSLVG